MPSEGSIPNPVSIGLDPGRRRDLGPFRDLGLEEGLELRRAAADRLRRVVQQPLLYYRPQQDPGEVRMQLRDNTARHAQRCQQAHPAGELISGQTRFGNRGHAREPGKAPRRGNSEKPQLPVLHVGQRRHRPDHDELHPAGDAIDERRRASR